MPELPEVETIRASMESVVGARIQRIDIRRPEIIKCQDYDPEDIIEKAIIASKRRGKFLVLVLEEGFYVLIHMGMSGRFYLVEQDLVLLEKHVHVIIYLDSGQKLLFQDPRRFGGMWFCRDTSEVFKKLGVEPLSPQFTSRYLGQIAAGRRVAIKNLLLNQTLISGIGNIYADEALFAARINPARPAGSLNTRETKRLHQAIVEVLESSIKERGTTFRDFRDGYNRSGEFQNCLKVYGKNTQPCPLCGQAIVKTRIGGRGTHFCQNCQH